MSQTTPITAWSTPSISARPPTSRVAAASICGPPAPCWRPCPLSSCCKGSRPSRCGSSATSKMRAASPSSCATIRASHGSTTPALPKVPIRRLAQKYLGGRACSILTFGIAGRLRGGKGVLRCAQAVQAFGQYGRRQVACLPSGVDNASANVGAGAGKGRRPAGDDPAVDRHRAHRRHPGRSRPCAALPRKRIAPRH